MREAFERLDAMLAVSIPVQTDDQLVGFADAVEALGRCADALRLAVAREFENRSDETLGDESLAKKLGARKAWGALETVTRTSAQDARQRVAEARSLAKLPVFEDAVGRGVVGRAQAAEVVQPLLRSADRAAPTMVQTACEQLVELCAALPASAVLDAARAWAAVLDPDGIEPVEKLAVEKRFFRIGRARNGLVKLSGLLPVEQAVALRVVIDAYMNPRAGAPVTFTPNREDGVTSAATAPNSADDVSSTDNDAPQPVIADVMEPPRDLRTRDQKAADILHAVFTAQVRSAAAPTMGGAHPTILVTVTKDELESGRGTAYIDGEDEPISAKAAKRIADSGGYQEVEVSTSGEILNLGRTQRCFSPQQRRALAVRDKGCVIPACPIPARWTEAHHVAPHRNGGPTDITNAALLCWWHHLTIDDGPYELRMHDGVPEVRWKYGSHASPWVKAVHTPKPDLTPAA